jgi:hypothetical protein
MAQPPPPPPERERPAASGALIYAMVARGTVAVAEHTSYTGNFRDIAAQCLHKLPAGNNRFTYTCDAHTFNFLVSDGYGTLHLCSCNHKSLNTHTHTTEKN